MPNFKPGDLLLRDRESFTELFLILKNLDSIEEAYGLLWYKQKFGLKNFEKINVSYSWLRAAFKKV